MNKNTLFIGSCLALLVTSMTFSIRAETMLEVATDLGLSEKQMAICFGPAFYGFAIATIIGGPLVEFLGMKKIVWAAFIFHILGLATSIFANNFTLLFVSTLFIGIANGCVEAACNPLVATLYPDKNTTMLNRFHVWFPGGIVIGGLIAYFLNGAGAPWQIKVAIMIVPTLLYGFMLLKATFPQTERSSSGTNYSQMFAAIFKPIFLIFAFCMILTASTELVPGQWIEGLLKGQLEEPILVLVFIYGIIALGRYFAGGVVHALNPLGMLLFSSVFSLVGLIMLANTSGGMLFLSAAVFAIGVCYFWPTMLCFIAEYVPESGALGMSVLG